MPESLEELPAVRYVEHGNEIYGEMASLLRARIGWTRLSVSIPDKDTIARSSIIEILDDLEKIIELFSWYANTDFRT